MTNDKNCMKWRRKGRNFNIATGENDDDDAEGSLSFYSKFESDDVE